MDLQDRVETLEREHEEHKADTAYNRSYGLLTAVFLALSLAPYAEDRRYTDWSVPSSDSTLNALSTFTVLAVFPLTLMLLYASIRLPRSPMFGWCVAGLSLVIAILRWIELDHVRYPSAAGYALIPVSFAIAALGAVHSIRAVRQRAIL